MRRLSLLGLLILTLSPLCLRATEARVIQNIDFDWYFYPADIQGCEMDNSRFLSWRKVDVPHDYSIEGTYDQKNGRENGFLPGGGVVWYKKELEWNPLWEGKKVFIEFDGAYMNSTVWLNGYKLGFYPNGYLGFSYDLTPYLVKGTNVLSVRLDNSRLPSARWYSGIGIYRHVNLVTTDPVHIARFGTCIRAEEVSNEFAKICVETEVNSSEACEVPIKLISVIRDSRSREVGRSQRNGQISCYQSMLFDTICVENPRLWSPDTPECYYMESFVEKEGKIVDNYTTRFGIRRLEYIPEKGFRLNGIPTKMKGVCLHQNMGAVGTALTEDIWHKRLIQLKEMGCNAIRTSHYPYAPEFYAMCDTLGFMVIDEPWDGWFHWYGCHKVPYDYSNDFLDWWEKDLPDFIKRDRNCPSVVMWSLGNEVWGYDRHMYLQYKMNKIFHDMDTTRPTTQDYCTDLYIDIAGFNANGECNGDISDFHKKQPLKLAVGTEIPHTRQTRGVYRTIGTRKPWDKDEVLNKHDAARVFPLTSFTKEEVFTEIDSRYASSYDNQTRRISVREQWKQTRDNDFFIGQFVWTGFDYLGESWGWPGRTNNYGIIDLAGFEKDHYYLYQSLWSDEPMVHVLPHWTHQGKEGVEIPVVVYTNGDAAELFYNGKSLGRKDMHRDSLQIVWNVPYRPGTIKAVAYKDGRVIASCSHKTAGKAYSLKLTADRKTMKSNRKDIVFVTVDVIDKKGNFVPYANVNVDFEVKGDYKLIGVENGDVLDIAPHKVLHRKTFNGKALLILQATDKAGRLRIQANSPGLKSSSIEINVI